MDNQSAYDSHIKALKILSVAYGDEPSQSKADRLRLVIGKLRDELYELVKRDLENDTSAYAPLNTRFKKASADLKWVRNNAEDFAIAAGQAAKLIAWVAGVLPLL